MHQERGSQPPPTGASARWQEDVACLGKRWKEDRMDSGASGEIVNAIRQGVDACEASEGEVVDGILVLRPAKRTTHCCDEPLELVAEARRGSMTWGLWRCKRCERSYSIGPKLPPTWVSALARTCIALYCDYRDAVAAAYRSRPVD
jgi:hypothetical protein